VNIVVGVAPVLLPTPVPPTIQNLGPGVLYFDRSDTVTVESGIRIGVGTIYTIPSDDPFGRGPRGPFRGGPVFLVSDTPDTDVRYFI
jgi:hypothetical protein